MTMWVDTVNKHIQSGDFDRKVIMESTEMNYKDDIPRPLSAEDHRPGNYHTVTIVQYDENNTSWNVQKSPHPKKRQHYYKLYYPEFYIIFNPPTD